jgi:hypothetical protein
MSELITKERETAWKLDDASTAYRIALLQQLKANTLKTKKEAFEEKKAAFYKMRQILDELEAHIQQEEMFAATSPADVD